MKVKQGEKAADKPYREMLAIQRKQEIMVYLKQRYNAGLLKKDELDTRIKSVNENKEMLMSLEKTREFTRKIGVVQMVDLMPSSPGDGGSPKKMTKELQDTQVSHHFS